MTDRVVISDCQSGYEYLSVGLCVCLARRISAEFGSRVPNLYACRLTVKLSSSSRVVSGRRSFLGIESASSRAQISLEGRIGYPPNINWPFLMVRTERLLRLTSKKQDVLPYPGLQKYAYLRVRASNTCHVRYACRPCSLQWQQMPREFTVSAARIST